MYMGFNKCIIPSLEDLKTLIEDRGVEFVIKSYSKCDCYIGDSDAINLLTGILRKKEELKTNNNLPL